MPIFGITASSNQSIKLTDFYQIATTTVGAGGTTYIDFTNIPQTFTHLQIRGIARDSRAFSGLGGEIRLWFNSDTGTNYSDHILYGNGTSAASGNYVSTSYIYGGDTISNSSTANVFATSIIDILDYRNTNKYKTTRTIRGGDLNGSGVVGIDGGNWRSTSAITSIRISNYSGTYNYVQYTSFQLYGVNA